MLISKKPKIFDVDLYGLAAVIAICTLTWTLLIQPLGRRKQALAQDQQNCSREKTSSQAQLSQLRQSARQQQILSAKLRQMPDVFKDFAGLPQAIHQLSQLSQASDLRLDDVVPETESNTEYYRKIPLSLKLQGTFPQLCELFSRIKSDMPYLRVTTFTINGTPPTETDADTAAQTCDITVDVDVFAPASPPVAQPEK